MNFFTKTRVLVTIIIVLAALNIATLSTVGFRYYKFKNARNMDRPRAEHPGKFMARQLRMSDEQFQKFEELRVDFFKESEGISEQIRSSSKQIMDEISSENPDTAKLNDLVDAFGNHHKQQKQMMIKHLLGVKSICTPDQLNHFNKIIKRMEDAERMRGNRNRNRAMHRQE